MTRAYLPPLRSLVAATATSLYTGGTARTFAHVTCMFGVSLCQRTARRIHDRVSQTLTLIGFDPGLNRLDCAGAKLRRKQPAGGKIDNAFHRNSSRICRSYSSS